ncbi:MAG: helix-turn-helix transcriptional regulator [Eubacteriales bacterium]|nr:helix-turn-helix transcriptional regulator [Eubacteriales bacterium]MDD3350329.1 helix-turn-helix transcriptional regulator [Eubacteriales bacterium]
MPINYDKLWKILIDKKMRRIDLMEQSGISSNVLARLGHERPISMESMEKICVTLNCNIGDVMEFTSCNNLLNGEVVND